MELRIEYLADYPEHISVLAEWHHEQFAAFNPQESVEPQIGSPSRFEAGCVACASQVTKGNDAMEILSGGFRLCGVSGQVWPHCASRKYLRLGVASLPDLHS